MDRHRFYADPDPDPTFHVDAGLVQDPELTPNFFHMLENQRNILVFLNSGASSHCFYLSRHNFNILDITGILKCVLEKSIIW